MDPLFVLVSLLGLGGASWVTILLVKGGVYAARWAYRRWVVPSPATDLRVAQRIPRDPVLARLERAYRPRGPGPIVRGLMRLEERRATKVRRRPGGAGSYPPESRPPVAPVSRRERPAAVVIYGDYATVTNVWVGSDVSPPVG